MTPLESRKDNYLISTDKDLIDIDALHAYLQRSYWAPTRDRDTVIRSIEGADCYGLYDLSGTAPQLVGFARLVTDQTTFGYLCDLYILEDHRGYGLSKWLVDVVVNNPIYQGMKRMMLATRDAHGLYRQFGFTELDDPVKFMMRKGVE